MTILNCIVNPDEFGAQNVVITTLFSVCLFKGDGKKVKQSRYRPGVGQRLPGS